ncbi:MAG: hypothetical protein QOF14_1638 [Hyphomicrobiales bacterium]|nr:hypothetical protein [Hyphomicrobiales bacterium]
MSLITNEQRKQLLRNGKFNAFRRDRGEFEIDYKPVVKLYVPGQPWIWLLGEINPDERDQAYGLWDAGRGPFLGTTSLFELGLIRDIRSDNRFVPMMSLEAYFADAYVNGRIVA